MGTKDVLARTAARKAAGVAQKYPQHAVRRVAPPKALPAALVKPGARALPVLGACPDLGGRLPGQPCGSQLMHCNRHNVTVTRFSPCSEAKRVCATCDDHPARAAAPKGNYPPVTTRHLLYHVYPVAGNGAWQWNVDQLVRRLDLFNGKKVVAVAIDPPSGRKPDPVGPHSPDRNRWLKGCDSLEDVRTRFGAFAPDIEFVEVENDPTRREVATYQPLFTRIMDDTGPGEVTLYAHAKGTTRPPGHVARRWTEALFEVLLDHFPVVGDSLRKYPVTGAFKKHGPGWVRQQSLSDWHYSGSWFWFRNAEWFAQPDWQRIDGFWSGIESVVPVHFSSEQSGCVFHEDRVNRMNLYAPAYWRLTVDPALAVFRATHADKRTKPIGPDWFPHGVRGWLSGDEGVLLNELAAGKRALEIGSYCGRSTICLAKSATTVTCIDPFDARSVPEPFDTFGEFRANLERHGVAAKVTHLRGTTAEVAPRLSSRRYDVIFVDGDHTRAGIETDLRAAKRLLAPGGVLALHDYRHPEYPDVAQAVADWGLVVERVVGILAVCRFPEAPPTVSVIVPTRDRQEELVRALASVAPQLHPGDEVVVVADATGDWGATPRTSAMNRAAGDYLVFLDDDDVLVPDALESVRRAVAENPNRPHLFRMKRGPQGDLLPGPREIGTGNVSSQMFVCPNDPARFGTWTTRYEGDHDFIRGTIANYPEGALVWRDEVLAVWRPASGHVGGGDLHAPAVQDEDRDRRPVHAPVVDEHAPVIDVDAVDPVGGGGTERPAHADGTGEVHGRQPGLGAGGGQVPDGGPDQKGEENGQGAAHGGPPSDG